MDTWFVPPIQISHEVRVAVSATSNGIVLSQGDGRWNHDLLVEPDHAIAIAAALQEGAIQCRAMRAGK
jgi:hypothetical protein